MKKEKKHYPANSFQGWPILLLTVVFAFNSCNDTIIEDVQLPVKIELDGTQQEIAKTQNDFAMKMFTTLCKTSTQTSENILISPFSLQCALGMLSNGASGQTKDEIFSAMQMNSYSQSELNDYFNKMITGLKTADPAIEFCSNNSIWYDQNFHLKDDFVQVNKKQYQAMVSPVDFLSTSAKDQINQWCNDATQGKIPEIIHGELSGVAALLNTIYFKARWDNEFSTQNTYPQSFYFTSEKSEKIPVMHTSNIGSFFENELFATACLPYVRNSYAMRFIVPKKDIPMSDVINALSEPGYLPVCIRKAETREIQFSIPRFQISFNENINTMLKTLGMKAAFNKEQAEFDNLTDSHFWISDIKQSTCLKVDEKGSEGAAVTVEELSYAPLVEKAELKADRPFLFLITENETNTILFIGKVEKP